MSSYLALSTLIKTFPLSEDTNSQIFSYLQSPTAGIISKHNRKYNPDLRWVSQTIRCSSNSKCGSIKSYFGRPPKPCQYCCIIGSYYDVEEYIWGIEEFVCRNTWIDIIQEEYRNKGVSEVKFGQWHRRYLRMYS